LPLQEQLRSRSQNHEGESQNLDHQTRPETYLEAGHFSVEIPGQFSAEINRLADWKPGAAKAAQKVAQLGFSNGKMTYKLPGQPDVVISCDLHMPGTDALNLRTKDLHDVIQAVLNEDASSLTFGADTGGMLRLGWSDRFGNYEVYLPTATSSGELSSRRLEPMRITASARAA
ncbi:MAG: hypothetical protein J0I99_04880, partial [Devosia sp.]|uniref:hypothetical protein n=1 Tax=Devosia sp. TaxID=1871048 RepID=UPI001AC98941